MVTQMQGAIVTLAITAGVSILVNLITIGIMIWARHPILNKIKLRKLIFLGYGIIRFIRKDKTIDERVMRLTPELKLEDGIHALSEDAVLLRDRRYPEFTFIEGEATPVCFDKVIENLEVACPKCKHKITTSIERPKTINPQVLDNLILKAKSEGGLLKWFKENQRLIYMVIGVGVIGAVAVGLSWDLRQHIGELLKPTLQQVCGGTSIVTK